MIASYQGKYFRVPRITKTVKIWRYDFVEGFLFQPNDGLPVYKKMVDITELDQLFDVSFSVKWNGIQFGCLPDVRKQTAYLRTSDKEVAEKYNFQAEEEDRGQVILWYRVVDLGECTEFFFHKTVYDPAYFLEHNNDAKTATVTAMSKEAWLEIHGKTVDELSPWNFQQ